MRETSYPTLRQKADKCISPNKLTFNGSTVVLSSLKWNPQTTSLFPSNQDGQETECNFTLQHTHTHTHGHPHMYSNLQLTRAFLVPIKSQLPNIKFHDCGATRKYISAHKSVKCLGSYGWLQIAWVCHASFCLTAKQGYQYMLCRLKSGMQSPVQAGRCPQETTSPNKNLWPWPHMMIPDQSQDLLK